MADPSFIDETHQAIAEFAELFLDEDDDREGFVDFFMEKKGYQRSSHWAPPEPAKPAAGAPPAVPWRKAPAKASKASPFKR